jgi:hypothetical protein
MYNWFQLVWEALIAMSWFASGKYAAARPEHEFTSRSVEAG